MMRSWPGPVFLFAALALIAALVAPVAAVVAAMPLDDAARTFARTAGDAMRVSLIASAGATLVATILGVPAGYALAQLPSRGRAAALFLLALPLAFPPVASGLMLIYALGTNSPFGGWLAAHGLSVPDTLLGVGVAEFFVSGSFVAIAATAAFGSGRPHLRRRRANPGGKRMAHLRARRPAGRRRQHWRGSRVRLAARDRRVWRDEHRRVPSDLAAGRALRDALRVGRARSARSLLRLRRARGGRPGRRVDSAPRRRSSKRACSRRTSIFSRGASSRARTSIRRFAPCASSTPEACRQRSTFSARTFWSAMPRCARATSTSRCSTRSPRAASIRTCRSSSPRWGCSSTKRFALENLLAIVDRAQANRDPFVRIDMEGSAVLEATLRIFERAYAQHRNVGPVLQAYLKRTRSDVERAIELGARVRLCKGAYNEPPEIAYQQMPEIRSNYLECARELLTRGVYPGIATHDRRLIAAVKAVRRRAAHRKRSLSSFKCSTAAGPACSERSSPRAIGCASTFRSERTGPDISTAACWNAGRTRSSPSPRFSRAEMRAVVQRVSTRPGPRRRPHHRRDRRGSSGARKRRRRR